MKRYFRLYIIALTAFLTATSCEQMISDVDAPASSAAKMVVTGFIAPDNDEISIVVSMTKAIYVTRPYDANSLMSIKDATVLISDGNDTVQLAYDAQSEKYTISQELMPVIEGKTYYLKVTAPGGYEATSVCTVPSSLPPDLEIDKIDSTGDQFNRNYTIYFKFRDLDGEGDYYGVYIGKYDQYDFQEQGYFYNADFDRGEPFVSDKNVDGQYFSYKTYDMYFNNGMSRLYSAICLTDVNYYKYHKALYNRDDENPFAEPYPLYSNIMGGIGVFAAFTRKAKEIRF